MARKKMQVGANDPCPCGSGKKYIECCLDKGYEFVQNGKDGKVSKRMKFRQKKKPKAPSTNKPESEKDFLGEILCKKSQKFGSIEEVPEALKKAGVIYRVGTEFTDIPRSKIRAMVPIVGIDFSEEGDFNYIRSVFMPKMTLKDLRNIYEILENEKLRVASYLGDPELKDTPESGMENIEDILLMVVTKDYRRHFNVPEDYSKYGNEILDGLISFLEGTKLEVLLEIIRRSLSDGIFKTIFSDI